MEKQMNGINDGQVSSRRRFLTGAAAACGAAALWSLHKQSPVMAMAKDVEKGGMVTVIQYSEDGKKIGKAVVPRVTKPDAEWQQKLSPTQFEVTRHAGTERAYTGDTWNLHDHGIFRCVCCDLALFSSETKFESGTGWPSFWAPLAKENVHEITDGSLGMSRTAVSCRQCEAHLGHVFDDGPKPTGLRYCMNSAAMKFTKTA